ncbi:hypothetical protein DL96DRAFT_1814015 [Flagelloscypha sp. PMI_526]|nr:hypothetical protein DL96DRAFT_1814015 [Flagelloscypha sp. PMI_526]
MVSSTSNQESRATKRRRLSDEFSESFPPPAHSPRGQPWFHDGNLILQSNDGIRFKIYRGLLELHSTVFADMLSLPQPAKQELAEGCPLVVLSDSGMELTIFLQLMVGLTGPICDSDSMAFDQLSIMLRLGNKYNFQRLRDNAVRILREAFPDTLQAYDNSNEHLLSTATELELAWLAFSESIDIVLPVLCYMSIGLEQLPQLMRDALCRKNGERLVTSPEFKSFIAAGLVSALFQQPKLTFTWLNSADLYWLPRCPTARKCEKAVDNLVLCHFGWKNQPNELGMLPLSDLEWWPPENGLCSICIEMLEKKHEEERAQFWEALPSFFGLPPWEELRQMQDGDQS